jgi:predicted MFS family arabinose efflux permease
MKTILSYKSTLSFSILLNFISGFGQTFLISIFVASFLTEFTVNEAKFGLYYSALTLISGLVLPMMARRLEAMSWKLVSIVIPLMIIISALIVSRSTNMAILSLGLFGLRLFGQGLCGHMSSVCIVKNINQNRGSALSLSSLGYPLSEATLPPVTYFLLKTYGWQTTWMLFSAVMGLILIISYFFARNIDSESSHNPTQNTSEKVIKIREVLRDTVFLRYLPAVLCAPFFMTGVFLYQTSISKLKGWDIQQLSLTLIAFALSRLAFTLIGGPVLDKFGAKKIFSLYLMPLALALIALASIQSLYVSWLFMILAGMSIGISGPIKSALWTEIYGPELHGRYRSISSSFMVFSTATAPFLFGFLIDRNVHLNTILFSSALIIVLASLLTLKKKENGLRNSL